MTESFRMNSSKLNSSKLNSRSKSVLLPVLVLSSIAAYGSFVPCQAQASHKAAKKSRQSGSAAANSNVSSASAGVQLIEEIFQRLRNVPQLALARSKQLLAFQPASSPPPSWGAADSNLLIRPAQTHGHAASFDAAPNAGVSRQHHAPNLNTTTNVDGRPVGAPADGRGIWEKGSLQAEGSRKKDFAEEADRGADAAKNASASSNMGSSTGPSTEKNILTYGGSRDQAGTIVSAEPRITDYTEQLQLSGGIAGDGTTQSAAQNTVATRNKIAQLDLNDAIRRANSPAFDRLARSLSGANLSKVSVHVRGYLGRPASETPVVNPADYPATTPPLQANADTLSSSQAVSAPVSAGNAAMPSAVTSSPSAAKTCTKSYAKIQAKSVALGVAGKQLSLRKTAKKVQLPPASIDKREEIALLPLTKFSGVPLVNLGDSDADLSKRLASAGTVEITVLKPWIVWSVKRPGSQECCLQVFSQKGLVEAVRIHDNSAWTNQQGVLLGDDVSVVKEKFGEPAFILSHPQPSGNKTYVYPISQVAFRLERASDSEPPRIKDIIIFNVK